MARRQRDYAAEYRARVERAEARGLSRSQATGKARRSGERSVSELRSAGRLPAPRSVRGRVEMALPGGANLTRTDRQDVVRRQLEQAAAEGQRVQARFLYQRDGEWRTATIGGTAGGAVRPGEVELVAGAVGADPSELLDLIDLQGELLAALIDAFDTERYG